MSHQQSSAGARLRAALDLERPLQIVGTINAFSVLLAEKSGFRAIYAQHAYKRKLDELFAKQVEDRDE